MKLQLLLMVDLSHVLDLQLMLLDVEWLVKAPVLSWLIELVVVDCSRVPIHEG